MEKLNSQIHLMISTEKKKKLEDLAKRYGSSLNSFLNVVISEILKGRGEWLE